MLVEVAQNDEQIHQDLSKSGPKEVHEKLSETRQNDEQIHQDLVESSWNGMQELIEIDQNEKQIHQDLVESSQDVKQIHPDSVKSTNWISIFEFIFPRQIFFQICHQNLFAFL